MKLQTLLIRLGRLYPQRLMEFYDHPGYQTGKKNMDKDVKKVFLCLDFTEACLEKAEEYQPDLILTHHPFFFGKRKEILLQDPKKKELEERFLSSCNCPIYSFHTNYDKAEGGMNDVLLSYLGWEREKIGVDGCLRMARLEKEMSVREIAGYLCEKFSFDYLSILDEKNKVKRIGFLAGGGGNEFMNAYQEGVDLYISGDAAHHARVDMKRYHMSYIELPHECEEKGFLMGMYKTLKKMDEEIDILPFAYEKYYTLFPSSGK